MVYIMERARSNPAIRFGVIVGVIGLIINIFAATQFFAVSDLFGLVTSLIAGAAAGFFAERAVCSATRSAGARVGARAGVIAGGLVFVGKTGGFILSMMSLQAKVPAAFDGWTYDSIIRFSFLLGLVFGIGLVGVGLAALTGAGAGYFATPEQAAAPTYAPAAYAPEQPRPAERRMTNDE